MHIDNGASTIYKDFAVKFDDVFEMGKFYCETFDEINGELYFWTLQDIRNVHKEQYTQAMLMKDYLLHLQNVKLNKSHIQHAEAEFFERANKKLDIQEIRFLLRIVNFKEVYYDLLNKLLKKFGTSAEKLSETKELEQKLISCWKEIKMEAFNAAGGIDVDLNALKPQIAVNQKLEADFRDKVEKEILSFNLDAIIEKEKSMNANVVFFEKNHNNAEIIREDDKYIFKLSSDKVYDIWDIADNAPQLLVYPEKGKDFTLESKIHIHGTLDGPFQSGLLLFLKRGIKLVFCLDKGYRMLLL